MVQRLQQHAQRSLYVRRLLASPVDREELLTRLRIVEADDRPCVAGTTPPETLDPMVPILDHQLVLLVSDDDGWRLPPRLDAPFHVVDVVTPELVVDGAQHRRIWRTGESMQIVERYLHGSKPPEATLREFVPEHWVVAPWTAEEPGHPRSELVALCCFSRAVE